VVVREAGYLARELLRIAKGSSSVALAKSDWRFADPTWLENPLYRRVGQAYLAFAASMDRLVDEVEKSGKDADRGPVRGYPVDQCGGAHQFLARESRGE
jgi:polyhydroxyalkanoate synthase